MAETRSITSFTDAPQFLGDIAPDFAKREVEHHLMLGVAGTPAGARAPGSIYATVRDEAGLALAAFLTPPRPLLLDTDRPDSAAITDFARWLGHRTSRPRGLVADATVAEQFIQEWQRVSGATPALRMHQRLHVLRRVSEVPMSPGSLRLATALDLELLLHWTGAFKQEAMAESLDPELREAVATRLAAQELYLWEDGQPRAMVATARPTAHGIALNSVFTPPEWRGRGYATTSVAALSQRMLDAGRAFCVLYTDLANPTSNAIYARVGYETVADSVLYAFSD